MAEKGLKHLERTTEKKLYKELDRKYERGIKVYKQFINNEKSDFDALLYFAGYLASLESVSRSGLPPLDIEKSLIDDTDIEIINDLRILCNVFENKFINSGILKKNSLVIFNPKFGIASMCCGGADADIFIDGTLYDFKCTKNRRYKWDECAQIVGYFLLNIIDIRCGGKGMGLGTGFEFSIEEYGISRLAFYRSRFGEIEYIDVASLDENNVEQGIEELRKLWKLDFI